MGEALQLLSEMMTPPIQPVGLSQPWAFAEQELEISLPTDYKLFIDLFGSGLICDEIAVWNFRDADYFRPKEPLREILSGEGGPISLYQQMEPEGGYDRQYPMYPEQGGLLPFAMVIDVNYLNWLMDGPPDEWDIVYWSFDCHEFTHFQGDTFTQFLLKLMKHEYDDNNILDLNPPHNFAGFSR